MIHYQLTTHKMLYYKEFLKPFYKILNTQFHKRLLVFLTSKINMNEATFAANQTQGQER